ncbi:uroporphyrinogen decarboxylase family protein [Clostridium sp. AWRP]|uniref:uroporphyrinogen decarboxylase family protein n=1 Tax=Clostridium sp. AWRP TaxID=2212991 RepID=UPI000FD9E887|nr:uroporphyrinogen decarboxylase family protein [Clostridium sp. AWRP]AZV57045.1 methylcobamide--CoM methyltransferase [Clostridium sp. AWRP]
MDYEIDFKCIINTQEEIPEKVVKRTGINFPEAHTKAELIAKLAIEIKKFYNSTFSMVPFCRTVEAEALGANIKMGDSKIGPRVGKYAFSSIESFNNLKTIDLNKGRIAQVLKSVEVLKQQNERVVLNVQGPFTIMSSLIDPMLFYRAVRKNRDIVEKFMSVIVDSIVKIIEEGVKKGAQIISFGDSAGTLSILGPKMYKDYSGRYSFSVLKKIEGKLGNSIIHLCGITSSSMDRIGFIKSIPIEVNKNITYGQAIDWIIKERKDVKIIGHNCIKKSNLKMKNPVIWNIQI